MPFRFFRRVRLAPGITLNLSKSTASLSLGPRGAKYTISPRGNRLTLGLPGTGLFYTVHQKRGAAARPAAPPPDPVRRLPSSSGERGLIDGIEALERGDETAALAGFEKAADLPDAAWMAGMLRLGREEFAAARQHLESALRDADRLGRAFETFDIAPDVTLPVAPGIDAHMRPCERSTRLALAEIAQAGQHPDDAMTHLERLLELEPRDPVVLLSFAELALDGTPDRAMLDRIVALTAGIGNETPVHTALLLYRGRALAALGLADAAIEVFTAALRRRKDRPGALLRQLRHDRAVLYEAAGRKAQARREFERIHAEDPGFADVRARLGFAR